jgi:hypothetical protein
MSRHVETRSVVGHLRRRVSAATVTVVLCSLVAAIGLAALAAVALDAIVVLSVTARVLAPYVLGAVAVAVLILGAYGLARLTAVRVARTFERRDVLLGTAVTNAVQFSTRSTTSAVEESLRRSAVDYGREKARRAKVWPAIRRRLLVALVLAAITVGLWLVGRATQPALFSAVLPRFLDPHGFHPPYSRVRITVEPGDTETLYAGQCEIGAHVNRPVEKLYIVAEDSRGATRSVMFRAPDKTFYQTLTNLREATHYYVTDGRACSTRHTIAIRKTPRITLVEVSSKYPAYTGLKPSVHKLEQTDLHVPHGTQLELRVVSNRPLESGMLELTPLMGGTKTTIELARDETNGSAVVGGFEADAAVAFELAVTDVEGLRSTEMVRGRVTILPDRRPRVVVLEPERYAIATPESVIPVTLHGEDDYAVAGILWFRGFNRSIERSVDMELVERAGPAKVEARSTFDLKDLGVRPGDTIEFFFEAIDNFPAGPNISATPVCTLQIISTEQYRELLRSMMVQRALLEQYMRLSEEMRRIHERAEALRDKRRELQLHGATKEKLREELEQDVAGLDKALGEYMKALDQATGAEPLLDVEEAFQRTLNAQRAQIEATQRQTRQMLQTLSEGATLDPNLLEALVKALGDLSEETTEFVGEPAYLIASVANLLARADIFTRLAQRQMELARQLHRFEEQKEALTRIEQMELQELAAAQLRVREAVATLMGELPELVDKLPDDEEYDVLRETVGEFIDKFNELKIQDELDAATNRLAELDGPEGYRQARSAADKMDSLVEKLEGQGMPQEGERCLRFQPALKKSLGNSLQQILAAMRSRGMGGDGGSGYGLYGEQLGLYGPNMQLAGGEQGLNNPPIEFEHDPAAEGQDAAAGDEETERLGAGGPGRVRLQRDVKFPLRYRTLVGEYFRAIAESLQNR